MTSKEKITSAQTSKNLGETPSYDLGDIDIIRACGMAGQSNPLGLSIWRWRYAGDTREVFKVAEGLIAKGYETRVVYVVLDHLANDVCKVCKGRGYGTIEGAPVLNGEVCVDCRGTGRRPLDGEKEQALVELIMGLEREIAGNIMRRLAQDLDL